MEKKFEECFKAISEAKNVTVLTGAGVSTLSGISDFRGKNGFYSNGDTLYGVRKEEIFDIGFFRRKPEIFFRYAKEYLYPMLDKSPSIAHLALAEMQKKGLCGAVYTQNIDTLHTKASGGRVVELHGTLASHHCTRCGAFCETARARAIAESDKVPLCEKCGAPVKPDVVFFGENLNEKDLSDAYDDCGKCDILLVLGSSLTVYPVAGLPGECCASGGKLVIVNELETPYDSRAKFLFRDIAEFSGKMQEYFDLPR
ncbi:MAG: Sir2 family NAD-dependent protein deacetylase [Lentisphaeria bacterium]|nr:Sir2 family NAD-dependent protein deacetylase [Lentisphaeria bacterium]